MSMGSDFETLEKRPSSTESLVLQTPNPLDLSIDDLEGLAAQVASVLAQSGWQDMQVTVDAYEPLGAGNNLADILYIILPSAEFMKDTIFATVVASVTAFMQSRFKRKHESKRPRIVHFFDPDGSFLGSFVINEENSEIEWVGREQ
jgi:hypothetical protein